MSIWTRSCLWHFSIKVRLKKKSTNTKWEQFVASNLKHFTTCSSAAAHSDSLRLHFISVLRLFLPMLQAVISSTFFFFFFLIYINVHYPLVLFSFIVCSHLLHWLYISKNRHLLPALQTFLFPIDVESQQGSNPPSEPFSVFMQTYRPLIHLFVNKKHLCYFLLTFNTQDTNSALTISKLLIVLKHLPSNSTVECLEIGTDVIEIKLAFWFCLN